MQDVIENTDALLEERKIEKPVRKMYNAIFWKMEERMD